MLVLLFVIIIIIFVILSCSDKKQEHYSQVLGSLAPYRNYLYQCLSNCEREDPNTFMGIGKGNWNCQNYCYQQALSENKKFLNKNYVAPILSCPQEVVSKCKQECKYSSSPFTQCVTDCSNNMLINCNSISWTWK